VILNVTVLNRGDFSETFNVTALWQNFYGIENKTDVTLGAGASLNLTFFWNTDVTYPPWPFGFDRFGRPANFTVGDIRAIAAPAWEGGHVYSKGVPFEKGLDYDYTGDNILIDGTVRVNRDLRYPVASINVNPNEPFTNQPAEFDGRSSYTFPGTTITSYKWDFGDGNVTEGYYPIIEHAYNAQGQYSQTLIVTNNLGLSSILGSSPTDHANVWVYDRNVKVASITVSQTLAVVGESIPINVTIKNDGLLLETFLAPTRKLSVYYDDVLIGSIRPPSLHEADTPFNSSTVKFMWDTSGAGPGTYTIKAVLDVLPYENNTADNTLVDGVVTLFSWDYEFADSVRGTSLKINLDHKFFQFAAPTKDYGLKQDPSMNIQANKITIRFEDAELRLRSMIIDAKKITCSARAEDVQTGEIFWLVQRPSKWTVGDVNYDGKVDVLDAGIVSAHWGPGLPTGPLGYDPTADLNNDGVIDVLDAAIVSAHWGHTTS
jgi:PKD repeat protein